MFLGCLRKRFLSYAIYYAFNKGTHPNKIGRFFRSFERICRLQIANSINLGIFIRITAFIGKTAFYDSPV